MKVNKYSLFLSLFLVLIISFFYSFLTKSAFADYAQCYRIDSGSDYIKYYDRYTCRRDALDRCSCARSTQAINASSYTCVHQSNGSSQGVSTCSGSNTCGVFVNGDETYSISSCRNYGHRVFVAGGNAGCSCYVVNTCTPNWSGWSNVSCGGGSCGNSEMLQRRSDGCGNTQTKCVTNSSCDPKPDLVVSTFIFPGGVDTKTSNPTVKIKNQGNASVTRDFNVRVSNGSGDTNNHVVTQTVSVGEVIDISGQFTGMGRPNAGDYRAYAIVDTEDDVNNESNENNNRNNYDYTTTRPLPDLIITTSFTYPGGDQDATSNPTVIIKNIGDLVARAPFNIRVDNIDGAGGTSIPKQVNQDIPPDTTLNVSSLFTGMPIPPARAALYTAKATVDPGGAVSESNENNNSRTDDYRSSNVPLPDLMVDTFVYPDGQAGGTVDPILIIRNRTNVNAPASVANPIIVRMNNNQGGIKNWSVTQDIPGNTTRTLSNRFTGMPLPAIPGNNYTASVTIDANGALTESNTSNNTQDTQYSATGTPPPSTHSITGGIFIDSDGSGTLNGTESYIVGQVLISGPTNSVLNSVAGASPVTVAGLNSGTYTLTYPGVLVGYESTMPVSNGALPPSAQISIGNSGAGCNTGVFPDGDCPGSTLNATGINFGIQLTPPNAWFQGVGGDMRIDQNYTNEIPATAIGGPYFSIRGSFLMPGIIFSGTSTNLSLGSSGKPSENPYEWLVNKSYSQNSVKTSYRQMTSNISKAGNSDSIIDVFEGVSALCSAGTHSCNFSSKAPSPGIYKSSDYLNLNGATFNFSGGNYIFLIDGDLNINSNMTVANGSTVMFIVNGSINIASNVTEIHGVYSAVQNFNIRSLGNGNDSQLVIRGSVIANANKETEGTLNNERYLSDNNQPSLQIIYRPDFALNAPSFIRFPNISYQEIAPGQ